MTIPKTCSGLDLIGVRTRLDKAIDNVVDSKLPSERDRCVHALFREIRAIQSEKPWLREDLDKITNDIPSNGTIGETTKKIAFGVLLGNQEGRLRPDNILRKIINEFNKEEGVPECPENEFEDAVRAILFPSFIISVVEDAIDANKFDLSAEEIVQFATWAGGDVLLHLGKVFEKKGELNPEEKEVNEAKAAVLYQNAISLNHPAACYSLGRFF